MSQVASISSTLPPLDPINAYRVKKNDANPIYRISVRIIQVLRTYTEEASFGAAVVAAAAETITTVGTAIVAATIVQKTLNSSLFLSTPIWGAIIGAIVAEKVKGRIVENILTPTMLSLAGATTAIFRFIEIFKLSAITLAEVKPILLFILNVGIGFGNPIGILEEMVSIKKISTITALSTAISAVAIGTAIALKTPFREAFGPIATTTGTVIEMISTIETHIRKAGVRLFGIEDSLLSHVVGTTLAAGTIATVITTQTHVRALLEVTAITATAAALTKTMLGRKISRGAVVVGGAFVGAMLIETTASKMIATGIAITMGSATLSAGIALLAQRQVAKQLSIANFSFFASLLWKYLQRFEKDPDKLNALEALEQTYPAKTGTEFSRCCIETFLNAEEKKWTEKSIPSFLLKKMIIQAKETTLFQAIKALRIKIKNLSPDERAQIDFLNDQHTPESEKARRLQGEGRVIAWAFQQNQMLPNPEQIKEFKKLYFPPSKKSFSLLR